MQLLQRLPAIASWRIAGRRARTLAGVLSLLPLLAHGQLTPPVKKLNNVVAGSYFLFSDYAARKTQLLYPPASLTGPVAAGSIQHVYFMYADDGGGPTFTNLAIALGQTPNATFSPATSFYANQDTVFRRGTYIIPFGRRATWFVFDLDQPFNYDPTQTLIVTVSWAASNGYSFLTAGDPVGAPATVGKKLYSGTPNAPTGDPTSVVWQHFGFTLGPLGVASDVPTVSTGEVFPNPATDHVTVTIADAATPATITLSDVLGRAVRTTVHQSGAADRLDLRGLAPGPYALTVEQAGRRTTRRLVVR